MDGIFNREFANSKAWKLDQGLCSALEYLLIPNEVVVDLGAGAGKYVEWMQLRGFDAYGFDGIEDVEALSQGRVQQLDLGMPYALEQIRGLLHDKYIHTAICIETGEHVPEAKMSGFLRTIAQAAHRRLIISWGTIRFNRKRQAWKRQRGRDHISCHLPETIANWMGGYGWLINEHDTLEARRRAGEGWVDKLLVFDK